MGINSTEVAYDFGQLGSAFSDKAETILPPVGHVIVAVHMLSGNTPSIWTPERLDDGGPGYFGITGTTAATVLDFEETISKKVNFAGTCGSRIGDGTHTIDADITLTDPPSDLSLIRVGQYVMLVDDGADEAGAQALAYDVTATGTPYPVYNGSHKAGVKVTAWDGVNKVKLDKEIQSSGEALIFLDEQHGAGGMTANSHAFPEGMYYGRWTAFKGDGTGSVICYFGK